MTRIDPITVLDAYRFTGIKPVSFPDFCFPDMFGNVRACPFVAVAVYAKGKKASDFGTLEYGLTATLNFAKVMADGNAGMAESMGIARRLLDVSRYYQAGFILGYDWWEMVPLVLMHYQGDYDIGLADGAAARAVLDTLDYKIDVCSDLGF